MADDGLKEYVSQNHEQCANIPDDVRNNLDSLSGMNQPRQRLKDLLLSAANDTTPLSCSTTDTDISLNDFGPNNSHNASSSNLQNSFLLLDPPPSTFSLSPDDINSVNSNTISVCRNHSDSDINFCVVNSDLDSHSINQNIDINIDSFNSDPSDELTTSADNTANTLTYRHTSLESFCESFGVPSCNNSNKYGSIPGQPSTSPPWCSYSSRRSDNSAYGKQTLISKILAIDDKKDIADNENTLCKCDEQDSLFHDASLDPLGSKYSSDDEWVS